MKESLPARSRARSRAARVGGDEGGDGDDAGLGEQGGDLADAADVLVTIFGGEAEVLAQPVANVVAVEDEGGVALADEAALDGIGERGFTGAREAGQPDDGATVAEELRTFLGRNVAVGSGDVAARHGGREGSRVGQG